jgi:hypothetical protein
LLADSRIIVLYHELVVIREKCQLDHL